MCNISNLENLFNQKDEDNHRLNNTINDGTTNIDDLNNNDLNNNDGKKSNMKDELKMFLKGVQKNDVSGYEGSAGLTNNVL